MSARRLLAVGALVAVAALVAAGAVARRALAPLAPESLQQRIFTVSRGEALGRVARRLRDDGLVRSALAFEGLARWRGVESALQVGEYELSPAFSPAEILDRIVAGRVVTYEVALPEGLTLAQTAERLAAAGLVDESAFVAAARSEQTAGRLGVPGGSLEGYLFPETYRLPRGLSTEEVIRVLVDQFHEVWRELAPLADARGLSMQEVVILASIVEKETGAEHERPLIASVFLNRLERGMRLETDPTVIYGIADFDGNLRRLHLEDRENPYNTYVIRGLPPGPIANPGREALLAVVQPAESDYLFFVSRNDGTHVFSRTYREHVNAVNRFQRGGRSGS